MVNVPSPAVAIVGRHNSGKTTLIEKLIAELVQRGHDVGSIKHHSHPGFEIDYPGKDSFRHRVAGSSDVIIAAPGQMARVTTIPNEAEIECSELVRSMPGHDVIIVEGYRKSGLPTIEIMRAANERDMEVAEAFASGVNTPENPDIAQGRLPGEGTVAIVTDIPIAVQEAQRRGIPVFDINDLVGLANFVEHYFVREHITVVIQAGGESRRMGRSKATVPFAGRPLICRLIERLSPAADEIIITTNEAENLQFLFEMYPDLGIRLVPDLKDFRGALPGLYTALNAASHPNVAVVACDMVFASASLVVAESLEMNEFDADVVVPVNKHGFEPFHAMYRAATCLPAIEEALGRGEKRAQSFFDGVNVREFPQERVLEVEPMGGCFINCNTPDELQRLEDSFVE